MENNDNSNTFSNPEENNPVMPSTVTLTGKNELEKYSDKQEEPVQLSLKDLKNLKKSNYDKIHNNSDIHQTYLIKNKKTNQIVELKAFSSFHACKLIGWKPNQVVVLEIRTN